MSTRDDLELLKSYVVRIRMVTAGPINCGGHITWTERQGLMDAEPQVLAALSRLEAHMQNAAIPPAEKELGRPDGIRHTQDCIDAWYSRGVGCICGAAWGYWVACSWCKGTGKRPDSRKKNTK